MEKERVVFLLQKHLAGTLTAQEKTELIALAGIKQNKEIATAQLEGLLARETQFSDFNEKRFMPLIAGVLQADTITEEEIMADPGKNRALHFFGTKTGILLIALAFAVAIGGYLYQFNPFATKARVNNGKSGSAEITPGGSKAMLTLSDGSTIVLDSASTGILAQQGNVKVTKKENGELQYTASGEKGSPVSFNTIRTPRGGEYTVVLSDGSRIKLNAFSSITYPTTFAAKDRNVTITGEAYFEIAKNLKSPFKVKVYDMEAEALGSEFNINAYIDEPVIKTTAIKGSIKLSRNDSMLSIRASQQGDFDKQGNFSLVKNADTNEVIAWKNGFFQFNNTSLSAVMHQIGRWYNVDIVYEKGAAKDREVFGEIRRNVNLTEIMKMLRKSGIDCRIDGRTFIVLP